MRHHHIIACCVELADLKSNDLTTIKTALCQINPPIIVERIDKPLLIVVTPGATERKQAEDWVGCNFEPVQFTDLFAQFSRPHDVIANTLPQPV